MANFLTLKHQADEYNRAQCEVHYDALKQDNLHRKKYDQRKAEKKALKIFRKDIKINNDQNFFKECKVFYNVHNLMKIHPRAFAQLTDTDKKILLKDTRKIDNQDITLLEISKDFKNILQHYRLDLECQFPNQLIRVNQNLNVDSLDNFVFNKRLIFRSLRPYQVRKLFVLLIDSCNSPPRKEIVFRFAEFIEVNNFKEFCAASELALILLKKKIAEINQDNTRTSLEIEEEILHNIVVSDILITFFERKIAEMNQNNTRPSVEIEEEILRNLVDNERLITFFKRKIAEMNQDNTRLSVEIEEEILRNPVDSECLITFFKRKIAEMNQDNTRTDLEILRDLKAQYTLVSFEKCLNNVRLHYTVDGLTFTNFWSAATHYEKHGKRICEIKNINPPSLKGYIKSARQIQHSKEPSKSIWSQDGSQLLKCYETKFGVYNVKLILSENFFSKKEKIVTFYIDEN